MTRTISHDKLQPFNKALCFLNNTVHQYLDTFLFESEARFVLDIVSTKQCMLRNNTLRMNIVTGNIYTYMGERIMNS